jgi:threonine dehydrogenase-like Zn-dependent dehydrogenase
VYDIEPGDRVAVWGASHQSLVTVGRAQVHVLDPGTGFVEASLVTLGAIAELGVARAGDVAGRPVTVIGAGAIGLLAQRIAAAAGASPCSVVAASTAKDGVVRGDPSARLCPPAGVDDLGAPVVIEATGAPEGLELAVRAAAPGATVVLLGTTRTESTSFPLDVVHARGLRVVGAHAGLLDVAGGIDGLDRRGAAQRFLDRQAAGDVRVDDLVTQRVDPTGVAEFYDRLTHDRTQVVPVIEWWRLAPDLRARPGAMAAPNPFRRGLAAGTLHAVAPGAAGGPPADVVEHPPAPARPAVEPGAAAMAGGGSPLSEAAAAVAAALAREGVAEGAAVQVTGGGHVTDEVQKAVADRGLPVAVATGDEPAPGGRVDVVVDLDPSAASVAAGLALLGPTGRLVVGGRVGPVELDVQTEIHKRGATVVGTAPDGARWQHG